MKTPVGAPDTAHGSCSGRSRRAMRADADAPVSILAVPPNDRHGPSGLFGDHRIEHQPKGPSMKTLLVAAVLMAAFIALPAKASAATVYESGWETPVSTTIAGASVGPCHWYAHDFTGKGYTYAGLWSFTFHTRWSWEGCFVTSSNSGEWDIRSLSRQEHADTAIGWTYDGYSLGSHWGCTSGSCQKDGREFFAHFSWLKYAIHDTDDLKVTVWGNGYWTSASTVTGP